MQSFKRPLKKEEEQYYLKRLKNGDLEAREKLIGHNMRLVAHIVKKYNTTERDTDDLISIGTIGLIKAVDTYDGTKGSRLVTYASRCIENELLMLLRREKKCSREVSLYEPIGVDREGNEISLMDILHSDGDSILNVLVKKSNVKSLYKGMEMLKDQREKKVLILRYGLYGGEALPQREVAESLGISRSYVSRIEKKALGHLRTYFMEQR